MDQQHISIRLETVSTDKPVALWGLTPLERFTRQVGENVTSATKMKGDGTSILILDEACLYDMAVLNWLCERPGRGLDDNGVRAAHVLEEAAGMACQWVAGGQDKPTSLKIASIEEIGTIYDPALRKQEVPLCMRLTPTNRKKAEWHLFQSSYKGVTDIVTKYLWPTPAFYVTQLCSKARISPNMVTSLSAIFVLMAFWLFWNGHFGSGLIAAWAMTFLDTVDGKLARTTLTSSRWGNVFDHGIDLIHPPFWYWAWARGLLEATSPSPVDTFGLSIALFISVVGYVLLRLIEGYFIARFKLEIHIWRRFDSLFRLIVSRRNPNLIILTVAVLLSAPAIGLIAIAIWTVLSIAIHGIQITQAETYRRKCGPLRSWMDATSLTPDQAI